MNEITFVENNLPTLQMLAEVSKRKKLLDLQEKELKEALQPLMEEHGITSINNEFITVSYVPESESVDIDKKTWKAEDPDGYNKVFSEYNRRTKRKAHIRFNAK